MLRRNLLMQVILHEIISIRQDLGDAIWGSNVIYVRLSYLLTAPSNLFSITADAGRGDVTLHSVLYPVQRDSL